MRLIQLRKANLRHVAVVEEPNCGYSLIRTSIYALASTAISSGETLSEVVHKRLSDELLDYDPIYEGKSEWHILPAIDHPEEPSRTLYPERGSLTWDPRGRQMMHSTAGEELTDSMRMFRWGMEGGRPAPGCVGIPPEWFYKGTGTILRAHNEPLDVPAYAEDGGEEAEIAGVYVIGTRAGLTASASRRATSSPTIASRRKTI